MGAIRIDGARANRNVMRREAGRIRELMLGL